MQWPAVWRTWKTRFRTWIPRRRCWMQDRTRGWSPWRLFAALSDSSQCGSEPKADVHSSVARDEPEWLFSVPPRLQTIENSMASFGNVEFSRWRTDDALQRAFGAGTHQVNVNGKFSSLVTSNQAVDAISLQERFEALEDSLAALAFGADATKSV